MYIIEVIPLRKGIGKETLSYFTLTEAKVGTLISVPIRGSLSPALIVEIREGRSVKSNLRRANFKLQKAGKLLAPAFFTSEFFETAKDMADYFATTPGAVLKEMSSKIILENLQKTKMLARGNEKGKEKKESEAEKFTLDGDEDSRVTEYKKIIREAFAKKTKMLARGNEKGKEKKESEAEKFTLDGDEDSRVTEYKKIIREAFAKKTS